MTKIHNLENPFTTLEGSALQSLSSEQSAFCLDFCQENKSAHISDAVITGKSDDMHR